MAENNDPIEQLENLARDYARAGWSVTNRSGKTIMLEKREEHVRLYIDQDGLLRVDGPSLPAFVLDGRIRAWLMLLLILFTVFAVAWAVGFFR